MARWPPLRNNPSQGDLEMPALIARNCANMGAINENRNGKLASSSYTIRARNFPLFDVIGDLCEPVTDSLVIGPTRGLLLERIAESPVPPEFVPILVSLLHSVMYRGWVCANFAPFRMHSCAAVARTHNKGQGVSRSYGIWNHEPSGGLAVFAFATLLAGLGNLKLGQPAQKHSISEGSYPHVRPVPKETSAFLRLSAKRHHVERQGARDNIAIGHPC